MEGWPGGAARFDTPSGIALAPDGTLVVADTGNNAIRRVSLDGLVTTIAGGSGAGREDGPAATARFDAPLGVAVAEDGTVFVADTYNDSIRRISRDGVVTTFAGGSLTGNRDGTGLSRRGSTRRPGSRSTPAGRSSSRTRQQRGAPGRCRGTVTTIGHASQTNALPRRAQRMSRSGGQSASPRRLAVTLRHGRPRPRGGFSPDGTSRVIAGTAAGFADPGGGRALQRAGGHRGRWPGRRPGRRQRELPGPGPHAGRVPQPAHDVFLSALPLLSPAALGFDRVRGRRSPGGWREVTATLGEARGSAGGDGREGCTRASTCTRDRAPSSGGARREGDPAHRGHGLRRAERDGPHRPRLLRARQGGARRTGHQPRSGSLHGAPTRTVRPAVRLPARHQVPRGRRRRHGEPVRARALGLGRTR